MHIVGIPILKTNYTWIIYNNYNHCLVVDPGEAQKTLKFLKKFKLNLQAILLTHNHHDHTNGVQELKLNFPNTIIYGPVETQNIGIKIVTISEGDCFILLKRKFTVFNFPGHTSNHIGFYSPPWLFCGDTVFASGCGKVQTGLIKEMYNSFLKISYFPKKTWIFGGHEYTLSNINFTISIIPYNKFIMNYRNKIVTLLKNNKPTIPTTLKMELKTNPFFCCNTTTIRKSLNIFPKSKESWQIFAELRKRKDSFK